MGGFVVAGLVVLTVFGAVVGVARLLDKARRDIEKMKFDTDRL